MHLDVAIKIFKLLPSNPSLAMSVAEITLALKDEGIDRKFYRKSHKDGNLPNNDFENLKRRIQRYINELQGYNGGLVNIVSEEFLDDKRVDRYYLNIKNITNWFMSDEAALSNVFSRQLINSYFFDIPQLKLDQLNLTADSVLNESSRQVKNISHRIRIVPDGIRRLNAKIKPEILEVVYRALGANKQFEMTYLSKSGIKSTGVYNPYGLVAKDGALYLLAHKNSSHEKEPWSFALHRVESAKLTATPAVISEDFNIDGYIDQTNNLSHIINKKNQDLDLVLKVAPESIYHFRERPLYTKQEIIKLPNEDHFIVKAKIPDSVLLVPFLLSMGGWINVVSPKSVRDEMATRLKKAVAHYL